MLDSVVKVTISPRLYELKMGKVPLRRLKIRILMHSHLKHFVCDDEIK